MDEKCKCEDKNTNYHLTVCLKKVSFWDLDNVEELRYTDKNEAIEAILDSMDKTPDELVICGYARNSIDDTKGYLAEMVIERLLESLDEDYGGEDYTEITVQMRDCAKEFVQRVISLYQVWRCHIVCRETIDVGKWLGKRKD